MSLAVERRAFPRVPVATQVTVIPDGCVEGDSATLVNISREGARVAMTAPVLLRQRVRLLLRRTRDGWCTAHGRVVSAADGQVSLCFYSVDRDAAAVIEELVGSGQVEEGPSSSPPTQFVASRQLGAPSKPPDVVKAASGARQQSAALLLQLRGMRR